MHLALPLLLAAVAPADLSFHTGRLEPWQGHGFYVTTAADAGPSRAFGVCSSDDRQGGRKALLHQTFVVPPGAALISFTAAAVRPQGRAVGPTLDVVLEAAEREYLAKQVRVGDGLRPAPRLLPPEKGRPREYAWSVAGRAGETLRIALIDDDDRPGCYLFCSGFRFVAADALDGRAFVADMRRLEKQQRLGPLTRLDGDHFLVIGDADDEALERRLYNCETLYALFFDHFRRKGFAVRPPGERMMVAVLASQEGFEAYLGRRMSAAITGVYDRESNRLLVYDYAHNRAFEDAKKEAAEAARAIRTEAERRRLVSVFGRRTREFRDDADVGTVMHEAAHQLSFNGGLLDREGDVPLWLAEGLACYCESTTNGAWQGVGEPNPQRVAALAAQVRGKGPLFALTELVRNDDWFRHGAAALGYAQSWALFRLLMEERPAQLRHYLELVRTRRTPDGRLDDLAEAFGGFTALDARYQEYLREIVEREAPKKK